MKHQLKRLTALVLALAMCLSLLSATAWAAEASAEAETAAAEVQEDSAPETGEADTSDETKEVQEDSEPETDEANASDEAEATAAEVQEDADPETDEDASDEAGTAAEEDQENADPEAEDASDEAETATEEVQEDADPEAEEDASDEGNVSVSASSVTTETYIYINPEYADVITEDDLVKPSEDEGDTAVSAAATEYCTTIEAAAELFRAEMKNRSETITVPYMYEGSYDSAVSKQISTAAMEHTGDPEEGGLSGPPVRRLERIHLILHHGRLYLCNVYLHHDLLHHGGAGGGGHCQAGNRHGRT